jgi:hypothetical protein
MGMCAIDDCYCDAKVFFLLERRFGNPGLSWTIGAGKEYGTGVCEEHLEELVNKVHGDAWEIVSKEEFEIFKVMMS